MAMSTTRFLVLLFGLLALPLIACSGGNRGGDDDDTADDDDDDDGDPCEGVTTVPGTDVALATFASGFSSPVHIASPGDGSGRLFVLEQRGRIFELDASGEERREYLRIESNVESSGEAGLLSMAFHPAFATNGRFYVYYSDGSGDTTVSEFEVDGDPATGLPPVDSERVLLFQAQPAWNHNGGQIAFGPDGFLYIGLGDGGGGGDTYGNGQRQDTFLAKILRIDVDGGSPYGIPDDNPFVGVENHRDETWAWGLRNPWRFSFDRETDDLWIADVGQNQWEEIHLGRSGGNYGWPETEGNHCFTAGCDLSDYEPAIHEYGRSTGISITGGFVYRGCTMPDLHGTYLYSDYNYFNSPLWSLNWDGNVASPGPVNISGIGGLVSSFGEDDQGEIYIANHSSGTVLKIVPE
jgi:glucose/arabinose dehydrogenase